MKDLKKAFRLGAFEQAKRELENAINSGDKVAIDNARYWFRFHRKALKNVK